MASIRDFLVSRPHFITSVIAAAMLMLAAGKWPYSYYQIIRWVVLAAAVFAAYQGAATKRYWAVWLFASLAVLFNPIVPIHFRRETWRVLDISAAAAFLLGAVVLCRPKVGKGEQ
jgi:hypothetical protein